MHARSPLQAFVIVMSVWSTLYPDHRGLAQTPDPERLLSYHSPSSTSRAGVFPGAATFLNPHVHFIPFLDGKLCHHSCDLVVAVSLAHTGHHCWFISCRNTRKSSPLDKGLKTLSQSPTALWGFLRYLERFISSSRQRQASTETHRQIAAWILVCSCVVKWQEVAKVPEMW